MAQVFVSHASEDGGVARAVSEALRSHGVLVWIAPDSILPGQIYNEAIVAGLRASDAIFVLVSSHANASKHVAREVALADDLGKRIVPIRIEAVEPADGLAYYLNLPQWVEWRQAGAAALAPVLALLGHGQPQPPPPPPPPGPPDQDRNAALVRILRPKLLTAMARNVAILVDGAKVGEVGNGGALELRVTPGRRELMARIDYIKSHPFAVEAQTGVTRVVQVSMPHSTDLGGQAAGLLGGGGYFTWSVIE